MHIPTVAEATILNMLSKCVLLAQNLLKERTAAILPKKVVYCKGMPEYIRVKVTAGAKKESVAERNGVLMVSVREPREENKANERVRELVAAYAKVYASQVRLVKGHHQTQKLFTVTDYKKR